MSARRELRATAHLVVITSIATVAAYFENRANPLWITVPDNLVGIFFVAAGLVAHERRQLDRSGRLMLLVGYTWYLGNLDAIHALARIAFWTQSWNKFFLVALLLTYPNGVTRMRIERWGIAATGLLLFFGEGLAAVSLDPHRYFGLHGYYPGPVLISDVHFFFLVVDSLDYCFAALTLLLAYLLVRRWHDSSPAGRRALTPLWAAGLLTTAAFLTTQALVPANADPTTAQWANGASLYAQLLIPLTFLMGLVRVSRSRAVVADLVVAVEENPDVDHLRRTMAAALGDPTLQIGFWSSERQDYLNPDGTHCEMPPRQGARAVTRIDGTAGALAVLIHDPELLSQQPLMRSVGAAARLVLENARLQAELRAQLRELRDSRARLVSAADSERRRLERDLHDGAQQRLLALGMTLTTLREHSAKLPGTRTDEVTQSLLHEAAEDVMAALTEMRELSRGIHPAMLTELGLAAAVRNLAERIAVPVAVDVPSTRWPPPIEATAYFVVSEALTNVTRHSQATRASVRAIDIGGKLRLEIIDDGVGGAGLESAGSGLRGLQDRVSAVDGSLTLDSPAGAGTRMIVELPCG